MSAQRPRAGGAARAASRTRPPRRSPACGRPVDRKRLLRKGRYLLRVVAQDLEPDDAGRLVVARKVAANRLVSLTDPQARHGRKSKSQTFEGFKVHVLGDVVSGLLLSLSVTSGNVHDGQPAHRLIRLDLHAKRQKRRTLLEPRRVRSADPSGSPRPSWVALNRLLSAAACRSGPSAGTCSAAGGDDPASLTVVANAVALAPKGLLRRADELER